MTNIERARTIIAAAERDLRCVLTQGQRRDLLCDNTDWSQDDIHDLVISISIQDGRPARLG